MWVPHRVAFLLFASGLCLSACGSASQTAPQSSTATSIPAVTQFPHTKANIKWLAATSSKVQQYKVDMGLVLGYMDLVGKHPNNTDDMQLATTVATNVNNNCGGARDSLFGHGPTRQMNTAYEAVVNDCITMTNNILGNLTGWAPATGNPWDQIARDGNKFFAAVKYFVSIGKLSSNR